MRQIRPRAARQQIAHDDPVVSANRFSSIGTARARFMKGAGAPDLLTRAVQFGVIHGDRMVATPASRAFLLDQPLRVPRDRFPLPGTMLGKMLKHAPARFQAQGRQNLRNGMLFPAQHHARYPLDKAYPAGPREDRGIRSQQGLPPCPPLHRLVHDAPPLLATRFGRSQPKRMPWGVSWPVKILYDFAINPVHESSQSSRYSP